MELEKGKSTESGLVERRAPASLIEHFPRGFDFFGQGTLEAVSKRIRVAELAEAPCYVVFQVAGEEAGLCVVALQNAPQGEEAQSLGIELANVLASKFVSRLADSGCAALTISPPKMLHAGAANHRLITTALISVAVDEACALKYEYRGKGLGDGLRYGVLLAYLPNANHGGLT